MDIRQLEAMKMERLNRWLTLTANVGVLLGIVFLAYELRQNNAFLEADAGHQLAQNRTSYFREVAWSAEYADFLAGLKRGEELTDSDRIRLQALYVSLFINWEWEFSEYLAGRVGEDQLPVGAWVRNIDGISILPTPGMREFWNTNKRNFDPAFVEYLDARIDK